MLDFSKTPAIGVCENQWSSFPWPVLSKQMSSESYQGSFYALLRFNPFLRTLAPLILETLPERQWYWFQWNLLSHDAFWNKSIISVVHYRVYQQHLYIAAGLCAYTQLVHTMVATRYGVMHSYSHSVCILLYPVGSEWLAVVSCNATFLAPKGSQSK